MLSRSVSRNGAVKFYVNGYPHLIYLRPKTSDIPAFTQVFVSGGYDVEYPMKDPKFIVDAGANVGYSSLFFTNRFPNAQILAIEPENSNCDILSLNTLAYNNIQFCRRALWNIKTVVEIENPNADKWKTRVSKSTKSIDPISKTEVNSTLIVPTITVNEILTQYNDYIDIFKIDIEGAEKELFFSNYEWIDKVGMFVIELLDWFKPGCVQAFYSALGNRPYLQRFHGECAFVQMLR